MKKILGTSSFDRYCFGVLLAIEVLMSFTFLGYIHFPPISITIAYLPIIVAACLFGPVQSTLTAIVFGLGSMYKASATYVMPMDMVFSPFSSPEPMASLFLSVGTRALMGLLVGLAFAAVKKSKHFRLWMCLLTVLAIRLHVFLVYGALGILFPQFQRDYTLAFKLDYRDFLSALLCIIFVSLAWELYHSRLVQKLKLYVDRSSRTSYVNDTLRNRSVIFFAVALTLTVVAAAYFSQRTVYMLKQHGIMVESNIASDLLHLQLQFVMAIIALNFILTICVLCAYKYLAYKEYLGAMDSLTGIMGRKLFLNNCQELQNKQELTGNEMIGWFLFFDVDYFKSINDTYGHLIGDKVLKEFAAQIDESLSSYGIVGRLGGDEFAAMLDKPISRQELAEALDDLYEQIADILPEQRRVTCSIGVCPFKYPQEIKALLYATDKALYKAKERGRACYEFGELLEK